MLDVNVVVDVIQRREPFFRASTRLLSTVAAGQLEGCFASYGLTTLYYVVNRHTNKARAAEAVDWVLDNLEIVPQDHATFVRARSLRLSDFEDAVLASTAEDATCERIVTRNVKDFDGSPVLAITPGELLVLLGTAFDPPEG